MPKPWKLNRDTFKVYQTRAGWRWKLIAKNGEPVATSELYHTKANALRGVRDAQAVAARAIFVDAKGNPI